MKSSTIRLLTSGGIVALLVAALQQLYTSYPSNQGLLNASVLMFTLAPLLVLLPTLGSKGPYWSLGNAWMQVGLVCLYLFFFLATNLFLLPIDSVLDLDRQRYYVASTAIYLATYTLIPALLFWRRVWLWPKQLQRIGLLRLIAAALAAFAITGIIGAITVPEFTGDLTNIQVALSVGETFVSAIAEEVVFRVMLLTYLAAALNYRFGALVISSIVFGCFHIPFNFWMAPELPGVMWLQNPAIILPPVLQTAFGFFLGVLWLRTRSLVVVGVAHALINVFRNLSEFTALFGA